MDNANFVQLYPLLDPAQASGTGLLMEQIIAYAAMLVVFALGFVGGHQR